MVTTIKPASTFVPSRSPIVDSNGMASWNFLKILQDWDTKLSNGLSSIGQILQPIPDSTTVGTGTTGIGTQLQNIDSSGVITANGIDFSRAYVNKNTDNIADGSGSPLAGGKAAEIALVTSPPIPSVSKVINGLVGGIFTLIQLAFSDLLGMATSAQIPALSELNGQITEAQLPSAGQSVTIVTAKLTLAGANGSQTFANGILVAQTPAT